MGEGRRTLFALEAHGVDISLFSAIPQESEVLLLPGCRFTTVNALGNLSDLRDTQTFGTMRQSESFGPIGEWHQPDLAKERENVLSEFIVHELNVDGAVQLLDFVHPGWAELCAPSSGLNANSLLPTGSVGIRALYNTAP